jgi:NADH-quinone oxidoreductase subunit H
LRQDQLMNFAWKFVLPFTLLTIFDAAVWHFMGLGWLRWIVCAAIVVIPYITMVRWGMRRGKIAPRSYRYAE